MAKRVECFLKEENIYWMKGSDEREKVVGLVSEEPTPEILYYVLNKNNNLGGWWVA